MKFRRLNITKPFTMEMQALMAAATEAHRDQQSQVEIRSKAMSSNRLKELLIQQQTTNEYSAAAICSSSTHWVLHKLNPPPMTSKDAEI